LLPWKTYLKGDMPIRRILLDEMPDMIEIAEKYSLSLLAGIIRMGHFKELGRPMLVHFSCERMDDNISSFLTGGKIGKWLARRVIGNYTLPNFDFHIANSPYTAQEFYQALERAENPNRSEKFLNWSWRYFKAPRVPIEERIFVCPRGVNNAQFSPERKSEKVRREMRERAGVSENAIVLLYAGRISPEKNIPLLVDFMEILSKDAGKDFRLLVAGAGPQGEWLKEQTAKRVPGKIIQFGHLDKDLLADYYANADVFVHPNPREPFGIAPLEAMASGVPVVAPNAGGILSYATRDNIWLVEPNGAEFAAAVREIIEKPLQTAEKVKNALETARQNTREKSTDNLLATYDKMYEDFQRRKELFTDNEAAKDFNFIELIEKTAKEL
jgi:glycosyltransferase involved in cell wall biosynthesis